jgi:hypothetical protein
MSFRYDVMRRAKLITWSRVSTLEGLEIILRAQKLKACASECILKVIELCN